MAIAGGFPHVLAGSGKPLIGTACLLRSRCRPTTANLNKVQRYGEVASLVRLPAVALPASPGPGWLDQALIRLPALALPARHRAGRQAAPWLRGPHRAPLIAAHPRGPQSDSPHSGHRPLALTYITPQRQRTVPYRSAQVPGGGLGVLGLRGLAGGITGHR